MHDLVTMPPATIDLDWWNISTADLERLGEQLIGTMPGGWVRRGDNPIEICGEYGAEARRLDSEMLALSKSAQRVRAAGGPQEDLRAATFYHLRLQRIHPLVEGNGRVGRWILAAQLRSSLQIPIPETLTGLKDWEHDYTRVFEPRDSALRFELLIDLLARITGQLLEPGATQLPDRLDPVHPQKKLPKQRGPRTAPESLIIPRR